MSPMQPNIKNFPDLLIPLDGRCNEEERVKMVSELILSLFEGEKISAVRELSGGVTNVLYKISFEGEKKPVLCRVNGIGTEEIIDREAELYYMFEVMRQLGDTTIYAKFGNGMVYDYVEGIPIESTDLAQHAEGIASQVARFHKLELEGSREPKAFVLLDSWIRKVKGITFDEEDRQKLYESIQFEEKILPEIDMMKNVMKGWEILFCHNDLLGYNIIYNEKDGSYSFIDYEYCGYNYVAFDIGDHFFEFLGVQTYDPDAYPSEDVQRRFVRAYLEKFHGSTPSEKEVEILRRKSNIGGLVSNLFWGTWAIFQARYSSIDFDYLTYGYQRFNTYFKMKDALFQDPNAVE